MPQISYLALRENIEVRRAGFAFRRVFDKLIERLINFIVYLTCFTRHWIRCSTENIYSLFRYAVILPKEVAQAGIGDKAGICRTIMEKAQFSIEKWRIGKTKVFIKDSDMVTDFTALHLFIEAFKHAAFFAYKIQMKWLRFVSCLVYLQFTLKCGWLETCYITFTKFAL